jgi:hypothetical protein
MITLKGNDTGWIQNGKFYPVLSTNGLANSVENTFQVTLTPYGSCMQYHILKHRVLEVFYEPVSGEISLMVQEGIEYWGKQAIEGTQIFLDNRLNSTKA